MSCVTPSASAWPWAMGCMEPWTFALWTYGPWGVVGVGEKEMDPFAVQASTVQETSMYYDYCNYNTY